MKSFIFLAIAVLLINVQGSALNDEVLENDYGPNDHRDYKSIGGRDINVMIKVQIQDKLHDAEVLDRQECNETSGICVNFFCFICQDIQCLYLMYSPTDNTFLVSILHLQTELYREIIQATDWDNCMQLEILHNVLECCVRIENVVIKDGHACVDLKISSVFLTKSLSNLCM